MFLALGQAAADAHWPFRSGNLRIGKLDFCFTHE
jgi:hypothetical protein